MAWKEIAGMQWNDIKFQNGGKEYKFTLRIDEHGRKSSFIGGGKHMSILDMHLVDVELIEEKGLIFKKHFIVMKEKKVVRNEIQETRVAVSGGEMKNAQLVVSFLKEIIQQREDEERLAQEKREQAKLKKQQRIDSLLATDKSKVICLDVETTGLNSDEDEILQLSIIDGNGEVLFDEYIKPRKRKRWPKSEAIHGISYQMVKDKPTIDEHLPLLNQIVANAEVIVGYNIDGFDIDFIREAGISVPASKKTFDVMLEFAPIYGQWNDYHGDYKWQKLATCARYYGYKKNGKFHDSLEDVRATLFCYFAMLETNLEPQKKK